MNLVDLGDDAIQHQKDDFPNNAIRHGFRYARDCRKGLALGVRPTLGVRGAAAPERALRTAVQKAVMNPR